ncbi:MAG: hypothetical protein SFY92_00725 [Verrucomicrobiae bacterium]|nr:hypothetical protein [Verrucomicrobiae bacterium]
MNDKEKPQKEVMVPASEARQTDFFQGWFGKNDESRTVDIYDAATRFFEGKPHEMQVTEFKFKNRSLRAVVRCAEIAKGVYRLPGAREELVERVLRKLAVEQSSLNVGAETQSYFVCVNTTLYRIRKELVAVGHGYKIAEIKEALYILSLASLELLAEGKYNRIGHHQTYINLAYNYQNGDDSGKSSTVRVSFHSLIGEAIKNQAYFPINHTKLCSLKMPLARWLATRINHNYRQATGHDHFKQTGFHISLETIIREAPVAPLKQFRNYLVTVQKALKELQDSGYLHPIQAYKEDLRYIETGKRPKLSGAVWTLYVSRAFADEIAKGNTYMLEVKASQKEGKSHAA